MKTPTTPLAFCCDKFEETPNKKVSDLSKLTKPYFNKHCNRLFIKFNARDKLKS